mmetsp:Transcript_33818/g.106079  ORF Transcript_33818/g.106079 Transcript_33818/m.106079 type:complete len:222 (+) Transcript_33818:182-847(+)
MNDWPGVTSMTGPVLALAATVALPAEQSDLRPRSPSRLSPAAAEPEPGTVHGSCNSTAAAAGKVPLCAGCCTVPASRPAVGLAARRGLFTNNSHCAHRMRQSPSWHQPAPPSLPEHLLHIQSSQVYCKSKGAAGWRPQKASCSQTLPALPLAGLIAESPAVRVSSVQCSVSPRAASTSTGVAAGAGAGAATCKPTAVESGADGVAPCTTASSTSNSRFNQK